MFTFDPVYFLFLAPALALSLWASFRTKSAFRRYSKVRVSTGLTGAQAAARMLEAAGISDVRIVAHRGVLTDHYNPMTRTLALSEQVYGVPSIAAVGVACHEAGHAIQHARAYRPLWFRSLLVPSANIGSSIGYMVMMLGLIMIYMQNALGVKIVVLGAALFSLVLLFQIVTLPVEFDASARAKKLAVANGIVLAQEKEGMDRVLNAAALTYVAAAVSTLMTLLYFLFRAGLLGGRGRN